MPGMPSAGILFDAVVALAVVFPDDLWAAETKMRAIELPLPGSPRHVRSSFPAHGDDTSGEARASPPARGRRAHPVPPGRVRGVR